MSTLLNGVAVLPDLGVIRVQGEDAARFLHGQLTQDFALLDMSQARLAAFCSAKGRMQASFVGLKRSATEIWLVCRTDLLAPTLRRLSMFVLRAKVRLSDATPDLEVLGVCGEALGALAPELTPATPWLRHDDGTASLVCLYPADGVARALWIAPKGANRPQGPALTAGLWWWGEVRSGVATLSAALVDALVPQMLNYESVGGVNFKKGCYPGQEVVARSQFRGTLKRRAFVAHSSQSMPAGTEIYASDSPDQPCGIVAQCADAPDGGWDAIVSLQLASAQADLRLGSAQGAPLALLPLPYPLLEDI